MKFKTSILPNEIIFIICTVVLLTFAFILTSYDHATYKEKYVVNFSESEIRYVSVMYYPSYSEKIYKRYIDGHQNLIESIERTNYAVKSPLYRTFSFRNNLLIGILCIQSLIATVIFFLASEKLSKCNYQLQPNYNNNFNSSNRKNENGEEEIELDDEMDKKVLIQKKRNIILGFFIFLVVLLNILTIVYCSWLPLNIRKAFITNQYYNNNGIDPLCVDVNRDRDQHIGKCRSLNGHITSVNESIKYYSWSLDIGLLTTYIILISSIIIAFFSACLILVLKFKKESTDLNNNNNNENPSRSSIASPTQIPQSFCIASLQK